MPYFRRINVLNIPDGSTMIYWTRVPSAYLGPVSFYVDAAKSMEPWVCLNPDDPVVDGCHYKDEIKRSMGLERSLYYRVRAVDAEGERASIPYQAIGSMMDQDWMVARKIAMMEYRGYQHAGGCMTYMLKRRSWGQKCSKCRDADTEEVSTGSCSICFGTGWVGGYFPGIEYWMRIDAAARERKVDAGGSGTTSSIVRAGRGVAYPWISSFDLIVRAHNNERFVVRKVSHAAEMSGHPIVFQFELHRLPDTDIAYSVPIGGVGETFLVENNECPSDAKPVEERQPSEESDKMISSLPGDDNGWRRGLSEENY